MTGSWWPKTTRRFIDMNVIENKYEFMCNLHPRVFIGDGLLCGDFGSCIYGENFLPNEDYGDKISSQSLPQTLKIKCFYLICF